jgi:hypothetical protein
MKRIYYTTARALGYRSFSRVEGPDVVELKRMLHALGYWRPTLAKFPDPPANVGNQKIAELRKTDPAAADKLQAESRRQQQEFTREYALYDEEAMSAVDKFRADKGLNYQGNPVGLVDARLVDALRAAYFAKRKSSSQ